VNAVGTGSPDLFGSILAGVSRSFYLTIRVLPRKVRRPIALGYLLARASDTLADSAGTALEERLEALRSLARALETEAAHGPVIPPGLRESVADPAERTLLDHIPLLLRYFHESAQADHDALLRVLTTIIRGQELDLLRFETPHPEPVTSLQNAAELDDYTYRVAGCVGEFWTRICFEHLPRYARRDENAMREPGIALGKGLQLVNILRDSPADLAKRRCYLPGDELATLGLTPGMLRTHPEAARPLFIHWSGVAKGHFREALVYLEAIRPWRLRFACFLPWAIGLRTLALLEKHPPLETGHRVKVGRAEVRRLMLAGVRACFSPSSLSAFFDQNT